MTTSGGTLSVPIGTYSIGTTVLLHRPITLTSTGATGPGCLSDGASKCAVLRASLALGADNSGVLNLKGTNVVVDHVVIDGNRANRLAGAAAAACASGKNNQWGLNINVPGCIGCTFAYSASINSLCGSALQWVGSQCTLTHNLIAFNGDHFARNMWSDGITLLDGDGCYVTENVFDGNSDVNFIMGSGANAVVQSNTVKMPPKRNCFAGVMLDNFNGGTKGNYTNLVMKGNTVDCASQQCEYGMQFGPGSWYLPPVNPIGGTVTGNSVTGANVLYNFNKMGTATAPITFYGNTYGSFPAGSYKAWCGKTYKGSALNVWASEVNRNGETNPAETLEDNSQCP
jgi:hypothetical protein